MLVGTAFAQTAPLKRQLEAAYLVRFAGFVEWPEASFAHAASPFLIGVAGNDALADLVEQAGVGRSVHGHALVVRRIPRGAIARGATLAGLHMLFVGEIDRSAMAELLASARGQALLTVSDSEQAAALGSMINFVVADERLRFAVAIRQVAGSGLRISARMLAVAHRAGTAS